MTLVLGVDPGGRSSGICLLAGTRVKHATVITRDGEDWATYLREIAEEIEPYVSVDDLTVAIEAVVKPKPYFGGRKQMLPVDGVMGTSRVYGAVEMMVLTRFHAPLVVVQPGGNGSGDLSNYPPELVGAREIKGGGILNHARSAYDVALIVARSLGAKADTPHEVMSIGGKTFVPVRLPDGLETPPDVALERLGEIRGRLGT